MTAISHLIDKANAIAKAFRLGTYQQAGEPLANLVNQIAQLQSTTSSSQMQELTEILRGLLMCHKCRDWLGVADYLEFEVANWLNELKYDRQITHSKLT